ncbi:PHP domain-containing protein [Trichococcus shcherbakoviae]|uniref:PHP domain-containing protein n=1 Tax=Trichococcus shcherbakoviae TaxID=2094020 RepID=UPI000A3CE1E7|nr:PHP domain-containing protein [Trichococcus shcherbakoviae]
MGYYDQHMHTHFSPDSAESFENYLEQTDGLLVTTEHLDFHDAYNGGVDTVLDYAAYSEKIDALNAIHDGRIRRGIEVGYTPESHARIMSYLEGKTFDVILLSVHQNGRYDYLQPIIDEMDPKAVMQEYFQLCTEAVRQVDGANIFAHFDYGIRRLPVTVEDLREFEPLLKGLLNAIMAKKMALELNTRSMYEYNNADLYRYMIGLYLEMGGSSFSLGSDAHSIQKYRYHFDDAIALLHELGVTELTLFKNKMAYTEKI